MTDFSKTEINVDKEDYSNYRILIVSTSWNREIIDVMQKDAISELKGFNAIILIVLRYQAHLSYLKQRKSSLVHTMQS